MEEVALEEDNLRDVSASEILAKIEKGELVEYYHVVINGDLDVEKLNLPKDNDKFIISSSIKIKESLINGIVDFSNIVIRKPIEFTGTTFTMDVNFEGSEFSGYADFRRSTLHGVSWFSKVQFNGSLFFNESRFLQQVYFWDTKFDVDVSFDNCCFDEEASFIFIEFKWTATFKGSRFKHGNFQGSSFGNHVYFNGSIFNIAEFNRVKFNGNANFTKAKFYGWAKFGDSTFNGYAVTFRAAEFCGPEDQEDACRRAKNVLEKNGDREEAGYHFYREMEAKRMQKPWYYRYPEFALVQLIFGYGVHPFWLIYWWLLTVCTFASVYALGNGINGATQWYDYIWFSIVTAIIPGRVSYQPISEYQVIAGMEAIFGTFMWAAFIATFARKYMR